MSEHTVERCTCDEEGHHEHPCPFQQEINEDDETLCACCPWCEQNCRDDI